MTHNTIFYCTHITYLAGDARLMTGIKMATLPFTWQLYRDVTGTAIQADRHTDR